MSAAPNGNEAYLLKEGFAVYRMGSDGIHFAPGHCEHAYVRVRGAEAKLPGPSVYLTGFALFQHVLSLQML